MAIQKSFLKSKNICKVTFSYKPEKGQEAYLVGDFNGWNPENSPLKPLKSGVFKGVLDLETGKEYEFKYFINGNFINDEQADAYKFNEFAGTENSVIAL